MDNLDIAIHLLQEAKKNRDKLEAYKYELQLGYDGDELYALLRRYTPTPTVASVNDNLKMARKLILKEYIKY